MFGSLEVFKLLLARAYILKIDIHKLINEKDKTRGGYTPLHLAAMNAIENENTNLLKILI